VKSSTVVFSILVASSAVAADQPTVVVSGPAGETRSLGAADLEQMSPREVNTEALLAFQRDGQPLAGDVGPFRLVVPSDKRGGRWVRGVVKIRVLD